MKLQGYRDGKPFYFEGLLIGNDTQGRPGYLERAAANSLLRMRADARKDGVDIEFTTAFRDHVFQLRLWEAYVAASKAFADATGKHPGDAGFYDGYLVWCKGRKLEPHAIVARPGFSNHQAGDSIDIPVAGEKRTKVYPWLKRNASRYGFMNTVATELWHWSYQPFKALS